MDKKKLQEIEHKLNPKTNGFYLFKEEAGRTFTSAGFGDAGLEAETNIEETNRINLRKKEVYDNQKNFLSALVRLYGGSFVFRSSFPVPFLYKKQLPNDLKLVVFGSFSQYHMNFKWDFQIRTKDEKLVVVSDDYLVTNDVYKLIDELNRGIEKLDNEPETEINEVSPYEESDWLQNEQYKVENNKISEWLKTTPEPYDHFHWDGVDLLIMKEGKIVETIERKVLHESGVVPEKLSDNNIRNKYGCLMTQLDIPLWKDIVGMIDPEDVYNEDDLGIEENPHVTILFGLHTDTVDPKEMVSKMGEINKIPMKIVGLSSFEDTNRPYDVVKFDVESDELRNLNQKVKEYPHTNEFDYNPHLTVAYVKKGTGIKYHGDLNKHAEVIGDRLVYSHPSGKKDVWELPLQSDVITNTNDINESRINLKKKKYQDQIFGDYPNGSWSKIEYDENGNKIKYSNSTGYWAKFKYDENGNEIHYENSIGAITDKGHQDEEINESRINLRVKPQQIGDRILKVGNLIVNNKRIPLTSDHIDMLDNMNPNSTIIEYQLANLEWYKTTLYNLEDEYFKISDSYYYYMPGDSLLGCDFYEVQSYSYDETGQQLEEDPAEIQNLIDNPDSNGMVIATHNNHPAEFYTIGDLEGPGNILKIGNHYYTMPGERLVDVYNEQRYPFKNEGTLNNEINEVDDGDGAADVTGIMSSDRFLTDEQEETHEKQCPN